MFIKRGLGFVAILMLMWVSMSGWAASPSGAARAAAYHPPVQSNSQPASAADYQQLANSPLVTPSPTPACGPAWNVISTTNVLTLTNEFLGISAADSNHVWAVGDYEQPPAVSPIKRTLIEQWDGYHWGLVSSPNANSAPNSLYGVAASTITDVWAVGAYSSTNAYQTLAEHWDGSSWQIATSANPGTTANILYGVGSYGANRWAVGGYKTIGDYLTLAEMWNGTSWQTVPSDNVGNADNVLFSVSGSMSGTWAVGYWNNIGSPAQTLIERWDGSAWHTVSSANVGTGDNKLLGVVATSDGQAWAAGFYNDNSGAHPLMERWNGTTWQTVSTPDIGVAANFTAIAAADPTHIWAVGASLSGLHAAPRTPEQHTPNHADSFDTLIERWDGTAWQVVTSPSLGQDSFLYGVTTVSADDAWAGGSYTLNNAGQTLAERYTGICPPSPTPTNSPTITPTPQVTATPTDCPNPFVDITGNIFYGAIHYLYCRGVVNGLDATHFNPSGTSTRGQFAKVVVLGFGTPLYTPTTPDFNDVPTSYYAYIYIESGFHASILSGFDQNTCQANGQIYPCYLPNNPITRGQLTKLVVGAAHYPAYTPAGGVSDFVDVSPSNVFFVSIETAYNKGVVGGYSDHTFRPNNNIRRDEMCQIVYKGVTTP